jgi:radical SAM superfamily enzyme YgiQ (UPF0313 family)
MRLLLGITNTNGFHEIPYSFGLSSIAASAQAEGHEVEIISFDTEGEYPKILEKIESFDPQVIGFSAVTSQFGPVSDLAGLIRAHGGDQIIVCGGIHTTLNPGDLIDVPQFDGVFVGESERSFNEFLTKIEGNSDYNQVNNFAYIEGGKVVQNALDPLVTNLETLPHPVFGELFEAYIKKTGLAPFFFSRGCPYKCTYCSLESLGKLNGMQTNRPRYRSPESCIEEIKLAREHHAFDKLYITDDIFGIDKKWRQEFCELYTNEIALPYACLLRVNVVKDDFLRDLKRSGCWRIQFGIESGNEYVRNTIMKRNLREKDIIRAFKLTRDYGIEANAINIIGVPGETESMIWDTIKFNRKINPNGGSGVNIFFPYKGTPLGDYSFDNGLVNLKAFDNNTNERRESTLKYSKIYKKKLQFYRLAWPILVYPFKLSVYRAALRLWLNDSADRHQKTLLRTLLDKLGKTKLEDKSGWVLPKV